jgi:hypothetical protein
VAEEHESARYAGGRVAEEHESARYAGGRVAEEHESARYAGGRVAEEHESARCVARSFLRRIGRAALGVDGFDAKALLKRVRRAKEVLNSQPGDEGTNSAEINGD